MARKSDAKRIQVAVYLAPAVVAELRKRAEGSSRNAGAEVRPPALAAGLLSRALGFEVDGSPLETAPVPAPSPVSASPVPASPKPGKAPRPSRGGAPSPAPRAARKGVR